MRNIQNCSVSPLYVLQNRNVYFFLISSLTVDELLKIMSSLYFNKLQFQSRFPDTVSHIAEVLMLDESYSMILL